MPKTRAANILRFGLHNRLTQPTRISLLCRKIHAGPQATFDPATSPTIQVQYRRYSSYKSEVPEQSRFKSQRYFNHQQCSRASFAHLDHSQAPRQLIHTFNRAETGAHHSTEKGFSQALLPLKSGYGSWGSLLIVTFVAGLAAYCFTGFKTETEHTYAQAPTQKSPQYKEAVFFGDFDMSQENQVGRVGHLTAEEEEKLKELWVVTLEVFGVLDKAPAELAGNEKVDSDPADSKKPKKKRLGMFRRGNKDTDSTASGDSGSKAVAHTADADDKYGQAKEFHEAIASHPPEALRQTFWSMVKHDHPDALLLRFLRARKWDVNKALIMMISTMRWRAADVHVDDDVMKNGELTALADINGSDPAKKKMAEDFLAQMRMGKSFFHGTDKEGRPMCFVRARLHKQGEQSEESLERYTVFTIETGRMILTPPTDTACVVFDLTGFSMANMVSSEITGIARDLLILEIGLCSCQVHDKVLRSQLSRKLRSCTCAQSPMDIPRSVYYILV
jgi:hypothetical protein